MMVVDAERYTVDTKKRSTLVMLAAVVGGYSVLRFGPNLIRQKLILQDLDRPSGFRKFVAGESSGGAFDPFIGLVNEVDEATVEAKVQADKRIDENICLALYRGLDLAAGQVPIASFSDYYCPFCRVQTKRLAELVRSRSSEVAVAWHELPLLGESSNLAAKAALAAKRQGAYVEFHDRLMRSAFVANSEYLSQLASDLQVDEERLPADMNSDDVGEELEDSAALSRALSLVGTPAMVIGRTVVQGLVSNRMINKIISLEREEGWAEQCGYAGSFTRA